MSTFEQVCQVLLRKPGVQLGTGRKGFGQNALNVDGKIFAMLAAGERHVFKLPYPRVAELVAAGHGEHFQMSGRRMKEWFVLSPDSPLAMKALADEAYAFVAAAA